MNTTRETYRKIWASILGAIAAVLLIAGALVTHKVYEADAGEFGILAFTRVSDRELVIDTTFSGSIRKGERLYTTYDRNGPRGKRACPT
ncbi:MAG: hypothetical protein QG656_2260 [Candidatus Hydrogenedentes bacterium]|nr:hypothetical protein [Candidatus Hydrogenedentota bacterium]